MYVKELATGNLKDIDEQEVNLQPQAKKTLTLYIKNYVQCLTHVRRVSFVKNKSTCSI